MPAIALLGLASSLLEGVGIGLLIPLLSLLIPGSLPPEPLGLLRSLSEKFGAYGTDGQVVALATAIIALIVVKCLVQVANACFAAKVDNRIADDIRNALGDRLLTLDYRFFVENDANRLARVVTTDSWFVAEAVRAGLALVPATIGILVFGCLLAWLNWTLFAIVVAGSAAMHGLLQLLEKRQSELGDSITAADQDYWARTWTLAYAGRVIRLFGQAGRERDKFAGARSEFMRAQLAARYHTATIAPFVEILMMVLFVTTVVVGFWTGMSPPALAAFLLLLLRLQPSISAVRNARVAIASAHGAQTEVEWLLRQRPRPEAAGQVHAERGLDQPIAFEDVSFTYPNGTPGVHDVSFTIRPGVTTALIGPSGSGKTTIVNLLCRLIEPTSGSIEMGGHPIAHIDRQAWLSRIAVAGQDLELIDGTVAENIAYGAPDATKAEIEGVAKVARAASFIEQLPLGYATPVGRSGRHLSGGERQRIALARALLRKPDLLILDEATSAVDALTEIETIRILSGHRFFRTALVISHRKSTLSACEDGVAMHDGQVVEAGRLTQLRYFQDMVGAAEAAA